MNAGRGLGSTVRDLRVSKCCHSIDYPERPKRSHASECARVANIAIVKSLLERQHANIQYHCLSRVVCDVSSATVTVTSCRRDRTGMHDSLRDPALTIATKLTSEVTPLTLTLITLDTASPHVPNGSSTQPYMTPLSVVCLLEGVSERHSSHDIWRNYYFNCETRNSSKCSKDNAYGLAKEVAPTYRTTMTQP
jgi:hypothetical protein